MYCGNTKKVKADAKKIAERLRDTDITLQQLKAEYHCAYETIIKVIHSQITLNEYKRLRRERLLRGGKKTRFKKNSIPWNKDKSYNPGGRSIETQFKKGYLRGQAARNYRPLGTITIRCDKPLKRLRHRKRKESLPPWKGKPRQWIKVKDFGPSAQRWIPYARYVWMKENGPVPDGYLVTHKDGNQFNDSPNNLTLINRAANMRRNTHNPQVREIAHKLACKSRKNNTKAKRQMQIFSKYQVVFWDCYKCGARYEQRDRPERCIKCGASSFEKINYRKTGP